MIKNKKKFNQGFTMVELLVAMSVFIIITVLASSSFINSIKNSRNLNEQMTVMNNSYLILEEISREIRTGYVASPISSCSTEFSFKNHEGENIKYSLDNNVIKRTQLDVFPLVSKSLTSENVVIGNLCFLATQRVTNGPFLITIKFEVSSPKLNLSPVLMQTSVSTRFISKFDKIP